MGRLFTVNFRFKEEPVTALVNLAEKGYDLSVNVRYLDKEVASLVPDGRLAFSLAEGIINGSQVGKLGQELVLKTSEAISNYLEKH
jgi:hypothetical protein